MKTAYNWISWTYNRTVVAAGIYSFFYIDPTRFRVGWDGKGKPNKKKFANTIDEALTDPGHSMHSRALMVEEMGIRRFDGAYDIRVGGGQWRGISASFTVNIDPELVLGMDSVKDDPGVSFHKAADAVLAVREGRHDGVYIDESEFNSYPLNYNREHFKCVDHPLTFDANSGRLAILCGLTSFEYYDELSQLLHERGKLFMANGLPYYYGIYVPLFDVNGSEVWFTDADWKRFYALQFAETGDEDKLRNSGLPEAEIEKILANPLGKEYADDELSPRAWLRKDMMYFRRSLLYQKSYNMLFKVMGNPAIASGYGPELFERFVEWAVFFGMYPAVSDKIVQAQDDYIDFFRRRVPVIRALNTAGWEPVTHARSDNPDVRIERFGYAVQDTLHFTVRNFGQEDIGASIAIDIEPLLISGGADVTDVYTGEIIETETSSGKIIVPIEIAEGETVVLRVESKE